MKHILRRKLSLLFLAELHPASLLGASNGYCQTTLVDESGMIRNQMGNAQ
jgi:hypothetical protein